MVEVEVRGAGWAGLSVAWHLRAQGVGVRVVDPRGPLGGASGAALGIALPLPPEHPHRLEAALGTDGARALIAFAREGAATLPGFRPVGLDWRLVGPEAEELEDSVAAAARLGLPLARTPGGFHLEDGGEVDLPTLHAALVCDVVRDPGDADVVVHATGWEVDDGWLADKLMPCRWQGTRFAGPRLDAPMVSRHASVLYRGGLEMIGARWATPHMEVGERLPAVDARVAAVHERLAAQDFPGVGAVEARWAGIVAEPCDRLPIVGPIPGRPREIACVGFGVGGLPWAWRAGKAVADGLLGGVATGLPPTLAAGRFR